MSKCAVVGCKSEYNPFNDAISFHRITRNKKYLPLWEQVVQIKTKSAYAKICSLHFRPADFIQGRDKRILKTNAVPSINIVDKDYCTDDEDDNKKLSILKKILTASAAKSTDKTADLDNNLYEKYQSQNFEMVMSCCNSAQQLDSLTKKQMSNMGIQTKIKTDKEISLQARVKLLELRLRRRDAKISYMQTVLNMIKKHTKGTDMEYKLCCELQNISEFSEPIKNNEKHGKRGSNLNKTNFENVESPASENEDADSSGDEAGTFVEVVHSPNLKKCISF